MISVYCRTNLDLHQAERFPKELPSIPRVGDWIESGHTHKTERGDFVLSLKVVEIRWEYRQRTDSWTPVVELHDGRQRTIYDFYQWYAPLVGMHVGAFV